MTFPAPELVLEGYYGHIRLVFSLAGEDYGTVHEGVKGVILTHADILVGIVNRASLTDYDVAGLYDLATELLESKSLAMRLTTVLRT